LNSTESILKSAWQWLHQELDRWSAENRTATFWWRDDDATEDSAALGQLLDISRQSGAPLAIAVIPSLLSPSLTACIKQHNQVTVLQHGYAHNSHALTGQKKLELGGNRPLSQTKLELQTGFQILEKAFGRQFKPVLVPPWNRIDDTVFACLTELGFQGISTMKARQSAHPISGLLQVNTHLDPINWRHNGGFTGRYLAIAVLIQHLQARRTGYRDGEEVTGILTHHLVQNDAVWAFLKDLLLFLSQHPAVGWKDAESIWQPAG
jgi:hypothetical protein